MRYAAAIGHPVDGTYLAYGPSRNLPVLLRRLQTIAQEIAPDDLHHSQ